MPSSITHAYIAKDVYKRINKKVKTRFWENSLEDYKTYAQGPDIFYFYKLMFPFSKKSKKIRDFGSYLHCNKVNEYFIDLTERIKKSKDFDQFLFLCGLLTHYETDSTIHPFINYKASQMEKEYLTRKDAHFIIETYIDNYMINQREKGNYTRFKVHEFCFEARKTKAVEDLLNASFEKVFKEKNLGFYYFESLKDMKFFFRILRYDPTSIKKYFYKGVNIVLKRCFRDVRYLSYHFGLDKDSLYLNLDHILWYNMDSPNLKSRDSFFDLYEKAVEKSKDKIEKLYEYIYENKEINLENLFGNKSYGNGLKIK